MRKLAFAAGAAALLSLAAISVPAQAQPGGFYPPPPPHRGYIVAPAYVPPPPQWRGHGHERRWDDRRGRWDRDHDGVPNRYDRDRDGDGVPNRFDRRPDNPYRY